jgi:single-stranded-DNA-specific exonuclease
MFGLKYKLIGGNYTFDPINTVLENRGISEELFNLDESVVEDYNNYDNIQEGIQLLLKHIENKSKLAMVVDPDVDGLTSYTLPYRYIKDLYPDIEIEILIHKGKEHGLSSDITIKDDIDLVILCDSASNDFEQHKELKDRGIDILVLDHHSCDLGYSKYAIVVNNQIAKNVTNKELSGVGVTYKFLKALDDYLFEDKADEYLDLVALGNVADMMDLHEKETRYFVYQGINKINNPFLKALIEVNSYDLEGKYNIDKIGWTIAPKLNGTIRSGTEVEKMEMVKAFISDDYSYCLEVAKMCKNIKTRQDNAVKSALKKIEPKIKINKSDRCIILNVDKTLEQPHTGLVAQKIADKYKIPTLLYREFEDEKEFIGGSFRGIDNISLDTRMDIVNSNIAEYGQGHPQAGGWKINKNKLEELKEYLNYTYKDKEISDNKEYEVDFVLEENEIDEYLINELAQLENEFGNKINIPLVVFKDVTVDFSLASFNRTNIIFNVGFIKFIKKYPTNKIKEELKDKVISMDIIGKCTIDTYNNTGQVEVVEFEIK